MERGIHKRINALKIGPTTRWSGGEGGPLCQAKVGLCGPLGLNLKVGLNLFDPRDAFRDLNCLID